MPRQIKMEVIQFLIDRDGDRCQFPGCERPFTDEDPRTIDHWDPLDNGGPDHIDNYRLMHRTCNSRKGNAVPDENGHFELRRSSKQPKLPRPTYCPLCESGRLLLEGEICDLCGSEPQPKSHPRFKQRKPKNCDHKTTHCWLCTIWPEMVGKRV
jgi:hypothetical protein